MDITYDPFLIIILAISILVVMVITLVFLLKAKKFDRYYFATILFGVYLVFLIKFVIFPFTIFGNLLDAGSYAITDYVNVIPFMQGAGLYQIMGNVMLLFPFGVYVSVIKPKLSFGRVFCVGLLTSVMIESVQLFLDIVFIYPNHFMDITDVILNVSGFVLGCLICRISFIRNMYQIEKN
ncbi:VanZ family protein [Listeria rustica]|uniref:VanZ family protein n=1 Tax=Listeria rustica TaxID=2713503 RepID=A0A7W1T8T5_9LIST|nr:VanZ family protein [Listeria rustica]MBA3927539.1 VanZ family protein [Listeria rustica]